MPEAGVIRRLQTLTLQVVRRMGKGLEIKSPVPSDIDIAQSCTPIHISQIAKQLNIAEDHYDLYGAQKAKAGHGALSWEPLSGAVSLDC